MRVYLLCILVAGLAAVGVTTGCTDDVDGDADGEVDADANAEADADADLDSDSDGDHFDADDGDSSADSDAPRDGDTEADADDGGTPPYDPLPEVACTHYIDGESGNNDDLGTSPESAWRTIQKAADTLDSGETVCILGGVYRERLSMTRSGDSEAFITFAANPGDDVLIDGSTIGDLDSGGLFEITDANYVRVTGLRVEESAWAAILVRRCGHIIIDNNSTRETLSSGVGVWRSDDVRVESNEVRRARYRDGGAQEWITIGSCTEFVVRNNLVHDGLGEEYPYVLGIDAKHSHGGLIEGNVIHSVRGSGIYIDGWNEHTYDIVVRNNFMHDVSRGISIGSERGGLVEEIDIYNNIVLRASNSGIQITAGQDDGPRERIRIFNNTINESVAHGGGGIFIQSTNIREITVRNNVVAFGPNWQGMIRATNATEITADHNLIYGEVRFPEEEVPGSIEGDPLFVDTSLGTADGFRLQPTSPAIDSGSAEGSPEFDFARDERPIDGDGDGTAVVDMGAFELTPP